MPRSKHPGVLSVWEKAKHLRVRDGELRATQSQKIPKGDSHIPSRPQNGSAVILTVFFIPWGYDWKTKGVLNVPPSFRVEKAPKAPTVIISQVSETISTQSPAASGCVMFQPRSPSIKKKAPSRWIISNPQREQM